MSVSGIAPVEVRGVENIDLTHIVTQVLHVDTLPLEFVPTALKLASTRILLVSNFFCLLCLSTAHSLLHEDEGDFGGNQPGKFLSARIRFPSVRVNYRA